MKQKVADRNPAIYFVALYIFVSMGRLHELIPGLAGLPVGKVFLLLALWAAFSLGKERQPLVQNSHVAIKKMVYFLMLATVSVSFSVWKGASFEMLKGPLLSMGLLYFLVLKTTKSYSDLKFYFFSLLIIAGSLAFSTATLGATGRLSVGSTFDPNDLAMVLVAILPFCIIYFLKSTGSMRMVYGGLAVVVLLAIILTGSRGGFLGLLAVVGYLVFKRYPGVDGAKGKIYFFRKITMTVIAVSVFLALSPPEYIERINSLFNLEDDYNVSNSKTGRLGIWASGIDIMMSRPYGVGIGAFPAAQGMLTDDGAYKTAHNTLLLVGVELGFLGLLLFLSFYVLAIKSLSKIQCTAAPEVREMFMFSIAIKASLLGFFVTSFFLSQAYSSLFYFLVALSVLLSLVYEKRQSDCDNSDTTDCLRSAGDGGALK